MTTFITGGTSSIGRVLVEEMSRQGKSTRVLVRPSSNREGLDLPGVELVCGDVTDFSSVATGMQGCDQVTHLAANVGNILPEEDWWRINREGTRNVLRAAAELGVTSMVQVSSVSVLGDTQPGEMADEIRPIRADLYTNLYQKTKGAADELAREFVARGLSVKIVYPGFGFGRSFASSHPCMQDQTLLRMAAGKPLAIMGDGRNQLCIAYYNDTVEGIRLAHRLGKPGEGYILVNENLTFPEIWEIIARVLKKKAPTRHIPLSRLRRVSFISKKVFGKILFPQDFFDMVGLNWCFSNQKARQELGWQPVSFEEAVKKTWEAYQNAGWSPRQGK